MILRCYQGNKAIFSKTHTHTHTCGGVATNTPVSLPHARGEKNPNESRFAAHQEVKLPPLDAALLRFRRRSATLKSVMSPSCRQGDIDSGLRLSIHESINRRGAIYRSAVMCLCAFGLIGSVNMTTR